MSKWERLPMVILGPGILISPDFLKGKSEPVCQKLSSESNRKAVLAQGLLGAGDLGVAEKPSQGVGGGPSPPCGVFNCPGVLASKAGWLKGKPPRTRKQMNSKLLAFRKPAI